MDMPAGSYDSAKHSVNASTADQMAAAVSLLVESVVMLKNQVRTCNFLGQPPRPTQSVHSRPQEGGPEHRAETVGAGQAGALPVLKPKAKGGSVAVFGLGHTANAIFGGTGSGSVVPSNPISPWDALTAAGSPARKRGFSSFVDGGDGSDLGKAAAAAAAAEVSLVMVGIKSGEGADRETLGLGGNQDALVAAVCAKSPRCVVVVSSPGAVLLPWASTPAVTAVLLAFMPGQGEWPQRCPGSPSPPPPRALHPAFTAQLSLLSKPSSSAPGFGAAIAELIFGYANPSGKLPLTLPNADNEMEFTKAQWPGDAIPPSGGYCKPDTYKVQNGGCFNDTKHQCGFAGSSKGYPTTNSWENAAKVCNENGFLYAGAEDGQGAEVRILMPTVAPHGCSCIRHWAEKP